MASTLPQAAWLAARRKEILRFAFILQFFAAIPFLWFGYSTGKVHARLLLSGAITTGTVVDTVPVQFSRHSSSDSFAATRTVYEAVVIFLVGDRQYRFQEWKATSIAANVGDKVPVIYEPANPLICMVDRGYRNFLPWTPCASVGLFLFLVALKGFLSLFLR